MFVRSPDGTWSPRYKVTNVDDDPTRPSLVLDEVNRRVCIFYSSFFSDVYYKCSDMDNIAFDPNGVGIPFMKSGTTPVSPAIGGPGGINNPSGMKQNPDPSTGILMIAATSETNKYWHNWIYLPSPRPVVSIAAPADGLKIKTGSALTFTGTATSATDGVVTSALRWSSSRDGQVGTGGSFTTSTLSRGVHTITASVADSSKLTGTATITVTVENDAPPVVTVTSPLRNQKFRPDQAVTFTGTAIDSLDGDRTANLVWTSDRDGQLGIGGSFARTLGLGRHTVTARATDTGGLAGTASLTVDVVTPAPPTLTPSAPADGRIFAFGAMVSFGATASDPFDGDVTSRIAWTSSRDNAIGTGGSFTRSTLSRGTHTVTASVIDSAGLSASATRTITVVDEAPPAVTITAPAAGTVVAQGKPITFRATASDVIDGDRSSSITWSSNRDGAIGAGATLTLSTLSVGPHTITASATDLAGLTGIAQVMIEVRVQPAPTVVITAPSDNAVVLFTQSLTLAGTASDTIDGDLSTALRWTSDRDGLLGIGASITRVLSLGRHTITAAAINSGPLTGSAVVHVSVESGPQIAILAPVDGSAVALGDALTFTGLSFDFEDGDLTAGLRWTSSLDGLLGTGGSVTVTLTRGVHTITA